MWNLFVRDVAQVVKKISSRTFKCWAVWLFEQTNFIHTLDSSKDPILNKETTVLVFQSTNFLLLSIRKMDGFFDEIVLFKSMLGIQIKHFLTDLFLILVLNQHITHSFLQQVNEQVLIYFLLIWFWETPSERVRPMHIYFFSIVNACTTLKSERVVFGKTKWAGNKEPAHSLVDHFLDDFLRFFFFHWMVSFLHWQTVDLLNYRFLFEKLSGFFSFIQFGDCKSDLISGVGEYETEQMIFDIESCFRQYNIIWLFLNIRSCDR